MFTTDIDVAPGTGILTFLLMIRGARIIDFEATGPAGHPNVTLKFETFEEARDFLVGWYPISETNFIESQIHQLIDFPIPRQAADQFERAVGLTPSLVLFRN